MREEDEDYYNESSNQKSFQTKSEMSKGLSEGFNPVKNFKKIKKKKKEE